MENPSCPICGSPTILRTAKKGKFAGQQFYGCTRYPLCKGIINIEDNQTNNSDNNSVNGSPTKELSLPRNFNARPRINGYQLRFFESVAFPDIILEKIMENDTEDEIKKVFSQWRIDFPVSQNIPSFSEGEEQILSLLEKILTRGCLTLISPNIEEEFRNRFAQYIESPSIEELYKVFIYPSYFITNFKYWFDSPAEEIFFEKYLPEKFGDAFLQWVYPQVEITSLITNVDFVQYSGRVDFLICIPNTVPVIIEIDGADHKKQINLDQARDSALINEGCRIIRIQSSEIDNLHGNKLSELENFISDNFDRFKYSDHLQLSKLIYSIKLAHQIQLIILQAIQSGFLSLLNPNSWKITLEIDRDKLFSKNDFDFILESAVNDLSILLHNLSKLYNIKITSTATNELNNFESKGINISCIGNVNPTIPTFIMQNISLPFNIANKIFLSKSAKNVSTSPEVLEFFLKYIFRKPSFWEGQLDAITRTLQGKDSIVLLPTGAGKSIAFQLASFLLPGRTIVIDPIISLMDDQIDNLQLIGIDRVVSITSEITDPVSRAKILELFGQGEFLFAYIAPERFQTIEFRKSLRVLTTHTPISLIAVDEAHCVSEWGHEFRTAYLNIGRTSRSYCESNNVTPPLLALTGTASRAVLKDIQRELQIDDFDAIITPKSFDRAELKFHVIASTSAEKSARLIGYLGQALPHEFAVPPTAFFQSNSKSTYSGLIFCPHVNGDFGIMEISKKISGALQISTGIYSGKEPKFYTGQVWGFDKKSTAKQFKNNQLPLLICTKAFGMGIDKPNIRYTFHFGIPPSIESFYQEAGRAGRDRRTAHCIILVSLDDPERAKKLLDPNTNPENILTTINEIEWDDNDDITRALFFQTRSFPGIDKEISQVELVINSFPELFRKVTKSIRFPRLDRTNSEKAIHRLLVLGIINDYTINYNSQEFNITTSGASKEEIIEIYGKYVAGYLGARRYSEIEKAKQYLSLPYKEFVVKIVRLLLHFIYDVIERGRRRALSEMLLAATVSPTDESIRSRILNYLEATQYSESLENIISQKDIGLNETKLTFDAVVSTNEAAELRGQVARYLESYPDHPSLLILRAISEVYCREYDDEIVRQNFVAAINSARKNYSVAENLLFNLISWSISKITERNIGLAKEIIKYVLNQFPNRTLARMMVEELPSSLVHIPAWFLLDTLTNRIKLILDN